eukprot:TRINITY_DN7462_c0_g2_i1.p1 TRINITY_DN7462_c0_g2~~TRINITY_DN7462_c0_g2_i1.p1  ORF type:complete len:161 (+),score=48.28 TRINITY_DN7462_c0_g2_i1:66-548(+)
MSREWQPDDMAKMVWGFAKMNHKAPDMFDAFANEAVRKMAGYEPCQLSLTAWGYATAEHKAPTLFKAMAVHAQARRLLPRFTPHELADFCWAFAKSGYESPAFYEAIAAVAEPRYAQYDAEDLSNLMWAYAAAGCILRIPALAAELTARDARANPNPAEA